MSSQHGDAADRFWSRPSWDGQDYMRVLARLHEVVRPAAYFEIGVDRGFTLALAQCASIAVDPDYKIDSPVMNNKPSCFFFKCPSDVFFREQSPSRIFGRPIDFAFLDGLHYFEVLLRDFINTEKHCRRGSIVLLHDCLPVNSHVGRRRQGDDVYRSRAPNPGHWAGDVWKTLAILKQARPDLKIIAYDAKPTGLIAITNLDPTSTSLEERYFEWVETYAEKDLFDEAEAFYASLNIRNFEAGRNLSLLSLEYWL